MPLLTVTVIAVDNASPPAVIPLTPVSAPFAAASFKAALEASSSTEYNFPLIAPTALIATSPATAIPTITTAATASSIPIVATSSQKAITFSCSNTFFKLFS